jgi:hypothetical protein
VIVEDAGNSVVIGPASLREDRISQRVNGDFDQITAQSDRIVVSDSAHHLEIEENNDAHQ